MATKNIVPRAANEGQLGTTAKPWAKVVAAELDAPTGKFSRMTIIENDFLGVQTGSGVLPLTTGATLLGTIAAVTSTANHPGIISFKSSTTQNSGYFYTGNNSGPLIAGGETFELIFSVVTTTGTTIRLGFHDTQSITDPVDGVWVNIADTQLDGYAKNNAGPTVTATHYDITQGVWYRAKIVLNADATLATFTLITCADGAQVWTDTVNANIPTGAGRWTCLSGIATNSGTSAVELLDMDWLRYSIDRVLVR